MSELALAARANQPDFAKRLDRAHRSPTSRPRLLRSANQGLGREEH
jgi:hypothetical protein